MSAKLKRSFITLLVTFLLNLFLSGCTACPTATPLSIQDCSEFLQSSATLGPEVTTVNFRQTSTIAAMWTKIANSVATRKAKYTVKPSYTPRPSPTPCSPPVESIAADLGIPASVASDYPIVDSSTSAHPLQVLIACKAHGIPCVWKESTDSASTRVMAAAPDAEKCPQVKNFISQLKPSGTHDAYMNLIAHHVDFILVARSPSELELQVANDGGVMLDVQPIALDAFVFLVHVENPVDNLPLEVVRRIYTGEIKDWGAATGQQATGFIIHAYQRDAQSGSQELMDKLVMQGTEMVDFPDMVLFSMTGPIHAIGGQGYFSGDVVGIGYSVYFYASYIFPHELVKLIGIEGVLPTSSTIADRTYPLTTEVFAVVREGATANENATLLRDWLLTKQGQVVVEESGYVPIAP